MNDWISVNRKLPPTQMVVDVWVSGVNPFRIPSVRYEWNGGTEGFWDWHYADESDIREGEPLQMHGMEPDDVTHWMPLPEPPKK